MHIIRADERYTRDYGWLKTAWLFSFDEYFDPENMQFGVLRVFNDDVVQPGRGFSMHPHREAEVITIPLSGTITHEDSMGNQGTVQAGEVQRMSAGTGVKHAEMNRGTEPVHLYQIWLRPQHPGQPPSYAQRRYDPASWHNRLTPVASGQGMADVVHLDADATIYRADLDQGVTIDYPMADRRCYFIYVTAGDLQVNEALLHTHDQARITAPPYLHLAATTAVSCVLIDLPPCE